MDAEPTAQTTQDLAAALARIIGPKYVLSSTPERERYSFDAFPPAKARDALPSSSGEASSLPDAVVRPGSVPEIQEIVRMANRLRVPIVPRGGGTGVMGAAVPLHGGIVVDLRRLDRILHVSADGMTVQAQAGRLLQDLDWELASHGLILGHDPWSQPIATVGGAISTDGVGYLAAAYGTMGEQVLGLEVVLPNGELLQARQVSASAGPWMYPLFIGAEGVLGIITSATLRVFPAPEQRTVHAIAFETFDSGYDAILSMGRRGVRPSMIDYGEEPISNPGRSTLYLAFEGFAQDVTVHKEAGLALCMEHGGRDLGEEEASRFWEHRHASAEAWAARNTQGKEGGRRQQPWGGNRWFDYLHLSLPPETVLDYKRYCESLLAQAGLLAREYAIWGRPDLFSVAIVAPDGMQQVAPDRSLGLSEKLIETAQDLGGSMEYCHGVGLKLQAFIPRELGAGMEALRAVKSALDPNNIMNPGKLGLAPDGP